MIWTIFDNLYWRMRVYDAWREVMSAQSWAELLDAHLTALDSIPFSKSAL